MIRKFLLTVLISLVLVVISSNCVYAAVPLNSDLRPQNAPTISGEANDRTATVEEARTKLTQRIVNIILGFAGVIAIFFIIQNGFWLITSAGREETLTQHKKGLTWAVLGLLLIILSYSIIRFVITISFQADEARLTQTQGASAPAISAPAGQPAAPAAPAQ